MKKTKEEVIKSELINETEGEVIEESCNIDDELTLEDELVEDISENISINRASYSRVLSLKSPQMYGDDVKEVQKKLNALGYNAGTADGYFGPNTDTAVRKFQSVNGLSVDGSVGPATWNKLFSSTAKPNTSSGYTRVLSLKSPQMYGDDVKEVQKKLNALGYNAGTADGYFGSNTANAVKQFQTINGLSVDGKVGPTTWNKLFSSTAKPNISDSNYLIDSIYARGSYNKMYMKIYKNLSQYTSKYCIEVRNYSGVSTNRYFKNDNWNTGKTKELYEAINHGNDSYDDCKDIIASYNLVDNVVQGALDKAINKGIDDVIKNTANLTLKFIGDLAKDYLAKVGIIKSIAEKSAFALYAFYVVKANILRNQLI